MKPLIVLLTVYLLLINALEFLLMHIDKQRARKNLWRIPEFTLLILSVFGGSIGCMLGMKIWHHKTRHPEFSIGVPLMFSLQVLAAVLISIYFTTP